VKIEDVWYGEGPGSGLARAALLPAAALVGAAVRVRGLLYDHGLLAAVAAPAPVVSIGALRVGGSGKTPFVLWLAAKLNARGLVPCIVTRGYGGSGNSSAPVLLDASAAMEAGVAARLGDEAVLLALRSQCPVVVGGDRLLACRAAFAGLSGQGRAPDLFLLDDGFQHRALARGLDVVLVSGDEHGERLMPAGPLRESVSALARAGAVVEMGRAAGGAASGPRAFSGLTARASARPCALVSAVTDKDGEDLAMLKGRRVVAVAAVARPQRFLRDLEGLGARVVASVLRRDHHRYDDADLREIAAAAAGADLVVTTEKDLVKLAHPGGKDGLRALRIEIRLEAADEESRLLGLVSGLLPV